MNYTVIVADYGEHATIPSTRAIIVEDVPTPEHAAEPAGGPVPL